jgi:RNA polymerase sigma factor (sigma-70 family)
MVRRSVRAELLSGLNTLTHVGVTGNLSDAQLLDRFVARRGEAAEAAFETLVARHGPMVLGVCGNVLRDPHNAQDAFQATFLVLASRAGSIRRRETLAGWLLGVARRVALRSRADLARRRAYEGRAAEMAADRQEDRPRSWPELHEEIGRLPERYREPVVLCYLEGLSTDAAAFRLGCPRGTVLSRLSRARERLRGRLTRRGLAPPTRLLTAGISPETAPAAIPPGLLTATVEESLKFAEQPATAVGRSSTTAFVLARGAIHAMMISKLKVLAAAVLICVLTLGGLQTLGVLASGIRAANADEDATSSKLGHENGPQPGVDCVDRLDFGELHVDAIAQAELGITFKGIEDPGISVKMEVPEFVTVEQMRLFRRGKDQPGQVFCAITLRLETKYVGNRKGNVTAHLGSQKVSVPVVASVAPPEPGRPKVLVISYGFGSASRRADYYRPWFDLVRQAKLDVSYMESPSFPEYDSGPRGADGVAALPEELTGFDVILLADGGIVALNLNKSLMLQQFADSGKRVIITASPAIGESVLHANRVLNSLGMHMVDQDVHFGSEPGYPRIEAAKFEADALLEGVKILTSFRPAPIEIRNSEKAKILAYLPGSQNGFVAVSRQGKGEVVAVGLTGLERWIGERGRGTDNARLLKNLLTTKPGR